MYFIRQKPANLWLIGYENNNLYASGDKDGKLCIYRKDFLDTGGWDEIAELKVPFYSHIDCKNCQRKMPAAAGMIDSKLWIISPGMISDTNPTNVKLYAFCIDLETKNVTTFKTEDHEINDFLKNNCMKCDALQITFEDYLDGNPRFMVQPYQIKPAAPIISLSYPYPWFKQFHFVIDNESKTCNFGYFDNFFENSKGIFVGRIDGNKFTFGIQRLMYDGFKQIPAGGDYRIYTVSNFVADDDMVYCKFYRDNQNELYCLTKEKNNDDSFKLSTFKLDINIENKTVSFDLISSFTVAKDFPDIENDLIFTAQNLIILSSSVDIATVINRILTLSEAAYLAIQNINLTKLNSSKACISMKQLRENYGIPKNVSINHGKSF